MFLKNKAHLQTSIFGIQSQLSDAKRKRLEQSAESSFYALVFNSIHEEDFRPLFSEVDSRPNAPVNTLVSSMLFKEHNGWTIEELFKRIDFDLLTRTALGLQDLEESPFCQATYFNFQNRLLAYYRKTGINLLEQVFDHFTEKQLKALKIKTSIQRMDSFQAMTNISSYSRVGLLVEVLIRLERTLTESDRKQYKEIFAPYCGQTSEKYVYGLDTTNVPTELEQLGSVYHTLYTELESGYGTTEIFEIFERVYFEHFIVADGIIAIKKINASVLQSPDDLDATFRKKNDKKARGYVVNVAETAHPDNQLNLITDVAVAPNTTDDSTILNERIDTMVKKTPDLEELHTDGGYGSSDNDRKLLEHEIVQAQTAIRGRQAAVEMKIDKKDDSAFIVSCPAQTVTAEETKTRQKACFDGTICANCEHATQCPATATSSGRTFYFDEENHLRSVRSRVIAALPPERQRLRPNVEATMKEYTGGFNHKGKLRVRGKFKTMLYAFSMAIVINFGRIFRFLTEYSSRSPSPMAKKTGMHDVASSFQTLFKCVLSLLVPKMSKNSLLNDFGLRTF
jgi:hypothetical protein